MFFSKVHPACHDIANGIKQEVTQKRLISMLPIIQKLYVIYVRCINCSYNDMAKGIRLLDEKSHFCLCRKNLIQLRTFESNNPLSKQTFTEYS